MPDVAYRDVLYMGLEYTLRAYPLIYRHTLSDEEKNLIVRDFNHIGHHMRVPDLARDYASYVQIKTARIAALEYSEFTGKLLASYRKALGAVGYLFLISAFGGSLVDERVLHVLKVRPNLISWLFKKLCSWACQVGLYKVFFALTLPRTTSFLRQWERTVRNAKYASARLTSS